jgi:hypothetical protein
MFDTFPAAGRLFPYLRTAARSTVGQDNWNRLAASAILILGAPRSGTTWLAKIIDSHPGILYRHEPDELTGDAKWLAPLEQISTWISQRDPRAAAKRPFFAKSWRPGLLELVRGTMAAALALGQRSPIGGGFIGRMSLPDLIPPSRRGSVRAAVKLVNWDGRATVATLPDCRCCFILRHPCGQVASTLAGWAGGRFGAAETGPGELSAAAALAETRGVGREAFGALPLAGKLAWSWLAFNEPVVEALQRQPNARIVIYEELCRQPEAIARDLFAFAGLDWYKQTAAFLATSTHHDRSSKYFDVFRETAAVAGRWRQSMTQADQEAVLAAVRTSPLMRYWPDPDEGQVKAKRAG